MEFAAFVAAAAVVAGAVASVASFGIGTILTPVYATRFDTRLAVVAATVPHIVGTAVRLWQMRQQIDRKLLRSFGVTSGLGGLAGALLHEVASSEVLRKIFGALLLIAAVLEVSGVAQKVKLGRVGAYVGGALSGVFGGMVGNQGGIRSAAMLGFKIKKEIFVATATAIGLVVDLVRLPVYLVAEGRQVFLQWPVVLVGTAGALIGTWLGTPLLKKIPERWFRWLIAGVVFALGVWVLATPK